MANVKAASSAGMECPELAALMARAAAIDPSKMARFGAELAHAPKAAREPLDQAIQSDPRRFFHRHHGATVAYQAAMAA